jgi:hypothetical protein
MKTEFTKLRFLKKNSSHLSPDSLANVRGLKARQKSAQGNALGLDSIKEKPCKGGIKRGLYFALSGRDLFFNSFPGRCPGLFYFALSAHRTHPNCVNSVQH